MLKKTTLLVFVFSLFQFVFSFLFNLFSKQTFHRPAPLEIIHQLHKGHPVQLDALKTLIESATKAKGQIPTHSKFYTLSGCSDVPPSALHPDQRAHHPFQLVLPQPRPSGWNGVKIEFLVENGVVQCLTQTLKKVKSNSNWEPSPLPSRNSVGTFCKYEMIISKYKLIL